MSLFVVMRLAAAKLPVTTEVIGRDSPARVGHEAVTIAKPSPRIVTLGQHEASLAASTGGQESAL